jgi:hypothetical protein
LLITPLHPKLSENQADNTVGSSGEPKRGDLFEPGYKAALETMRCIMDRPLARDEICDEILQKL